jgi:hypothetical protein
MHPYLAVPVAGLILWGLAALLARTVKPREVPSNAAGRVVRTAVEQRPYFVMSLGGGHYEVRREDAPDVWVIIDQEGERAQSGDAAELATLRSDMNRFPSSLFDDLRVAGFLDFESPVSDEARTFAPAWYTVLTYDPHRRAWSYAPLFREENPARAQVRAPMGAYTFRWLEREKRWTRIG